MKDDSCVTFLQWALPRMHMRWPGFRKVRGQVYKRISRRLKELHLPDLESYRAYLESEPREWHILDTLCRITISRFYRNRGAFDSLRTAILPGLVENARQIGDRTISCWCIGSASGEEPYSLSLLWDLSGMDRHGLDLEILAIEVDGRMIDRAQRGCYPESSVHELPAEVLQEAFTTDSGLFCLKEQYKKRVRFMQQDIRNAQPDSNFHLVLCRNIVFTYFSHELQEEITKRILKCMKPEGVLVLGTHESLPGSVSGLVPWLPGKAIYKKSGK